MRIPRVSEMSMEQRQMALAIALVSGLDERTARRGVVHGVDRLRSRRARELYVQGIAELMSVSAEDAR